MVLFQSPESRSFVNSRSGTFGPPPLRQWHSDDQHWHAKWCSHRPAPQSTPHTAVCVLPDQATETWPHTGNCLVTPLYVYSLTKRRRHDLTQVTVSLHRCMCTPWPRDIDMTSQRWVLVPLLNHYKSAFLYFYNQIFVMKYLKFQGLSQVIQSMFNMNILSIIWSLSKGIFSRNKIIWF